MSTPAWEAYEVEGSPYFVYVDGASGAVVGEGTASSWERVREMIDESVGDGALAASRRRAAARKARADASSPRRPSSARRAPTTRCSRPVSAPGDPRLYPATGGPANRARRVVTATAVRDVRGLALVAVGIAVVAGLRSTWSP